MKEIVINASRETPFNELLEYIKGELPLSLSRVLKQRREYLEAYKEYLGIANTILAKKERKVAAAEKQLEQEKTQLKDAEQKLKVNDSPIKTNRKLQNVQRRDTSTKPVDNLTDEHKDITRKKDSVIFFEQILNKMREEFEKGFDAKELKNNLPIPNDWTKKSVKNKRPLLLYLGLNEQLKIHDPNRYARHKLALITCNKDRLETQKTQYEELTTEVNELDTKINSQILSNEIINMDLIYNILICYFASQEDGIYNHLAKLLIIPLSVCSHLQTSLIKIIKKYKLTKTKLFEQMSINDNRFNIKLKSLNCYDESKLYKKRPRVRFAETVEVENIYNNGNRKISLNALKDEIDKWTYPGQSQTFIPSGHLIKGPMRLNADELTRDMVQTISEQDLWASDGEYDRRRLKSIGDLRGLNTSNIAPNNRPTLGALKTKESDDIRTKFRNFIDESEQKIKMKWEEEAGWKTLKEKYRQHEADLDTLCKDMWDLMYKQVIENITIAENEEYIGPEPEIPREVMNDSAKFITWRNNVSTSMSEEPNNAATKKIISDYNIDNQEWKRKTQEEEERKKSVKDKIDAAYNKIKEGNPFNPTSLPSLHNAMKPPPKKSAMKQVVRAPWEHNHREDEAKRGGGQNNVSTPPWEPTPLSLQNVVAELQLPDELDIPDNITKLLKILHKCTVKNGDIESRVGTSESNVSNTHVKEMRNSIINLMREMKQKYYELFNKQLFSEDEMNSFRFERKNYDSPHYNPYLDPHVGQHLTGGKGKKTRKVRKARKGKQTKKGRKVRKVIKVRKVRKGKQTKKERKVKKIIRIGKQTKKGRKGKLLRKGKKQTKQHPKNNIKIVILKKTKKT